MLDPKIQTLGEKIEAAERILLISHIRPDGDAVGSLLGLGISLEAAGKEVNLVLEDGVPLVFHHLSSVDEVYREPAGVYDLIITLDSSDISRTGEVLDEYGQPDVNIDHHPTNTQFGHLNIIREDAVATAEIVLEIIKQLELPLSKESAEALLTGIITDSLGFRTSNTTPGALRAAADLQEMGADLPDLYSRALLLKSFEALRYWGRGLSQIEKDDRLVWTILSLEDRKAADYSGRDDADLINVLSTITGTDVCIIFVEQTDGTTKISWRAKPGFDVARIAMKFGGGGHTPAAGASVRGELENIVKDVVETTRTEIQSEAESGQ
jgi:phosphoesterase RecJ-like protein